MKPKLLATAVAISAVSTVSAHATTIIDPFSNGDTQVFGSSITTTGNAENLYIGFNGQPGAVEINAGSDGNGITDVTVDSDAIVGIFFDSGDSSGLLRVIGDGTEGSATLTVGDRITAGNGANGTIEIRDGGIINANSVQLGSGSGDVSVIIDGKGSQLNAINGSLRFSDVAEGSTRELLITNGGVATANGEPENFLGSVRVNSLDSAVVDGVGSRIEFTSGLNVEGELVVQNGGAVVDTGSSVERDDFFSVLIGSRRDTLTGSTPPVAIIEVSGDDSNIALTQDVVIGGFNLLIDADFSDPDNSILTFEGTTAEVVVDDNGTFQTDRNIRVSTNDGLSNTDGSDGLNLSEGYGVLTVASGGTVIANQLTIEKNGQLNGDGGTIVADVVLDGGTIAPGMSPGILNIDGDLEVLDGLFEIEIAGTGAGMFDQLNITGDLIASMGFNIEISFLDSFIPQEGDIFNFLNIAGDSSIFDTPSLINFSVNGGGLFGNNAALDFAGGNLSLVTDTSVAPVPLPAGFPMLVAGLVGLGWIGKRRKTATAIAA